MAEDKYTNFEDYEKWHANHKNDKAPSKKIIALGKKRSEEHTSELQSQR